MAKLFITPMTMVGLEGYQRTGKDMLATLGPGATTVVVDFGSGAAVSVELPHVADPTAARNYRLYADAACHIKAHAAGDNLNVKATTSDMPLPAAAVEYFEPGPGLVYISAIAAS